MVYTLVVRYTVVVTKTPPRDKLKVPEILTEEGLDVADRVPEELETRELTVEAPGAGWPASSGGT